MNFQIYYLGLLFIFAVIASMMVIDKNVGTYIILLGQVVRIKIIKYWFWLKLYPKLRFDTAILKWKSNKILKDLKIKNK